MSIQWFPGHMAKAKRLLTENLDLIDVVLEIIDARAPLSSYNEDLRGLYLNKTVYKILTKSDLAAPLATKAWLDYFKEKDQIAIAVDVPKRKGLEDIHIQLRIEHQRIANLLALKQRRPRSVRLLVAGIPNVGKSSLINAFVKKEAAKAANTPGVTKGQQWVRIAKDIELLDSPGIMPPKFFNQEVGLTLAALGCIKTEVFSEEEVAIWLLQKLQKLAPGAVKARYKLEEEYNTSDTLDKIAQRVGLINKGNIPDTTKAARHFLKEFQSAKFGRITLESPS